MSSVKWERIRKVLSVTLQRGSARNLDFGSWERDPEDVGESRFGDHFPDLPGGNSRELVLCDWPA